MPVGDDSIRETLEGVYDKLEKYGEELDGASDRAAAITAAAFFEAELERAIGHMLARRNSEIAARIDSGKRVFGKGGPLRHMSAKIEMGWAVGLYGGDEKERLRIAAGIRNRFAHASDPIGFADEKVARKCDALAEGAGSVGSDACPRTTYLGYLKRLERHMHEVVTSVERSVQDAHD